MTPEKNEELRKFVYGLQGQAVALYCTAPAGSEIQLQALALVEGCAQLLQMLNDESPRASQAMADALKTVIH